VASATPDYGYLPSCKALPSTGWYQIILHGDRGTCVLTTCPADASVAAARAFAIAGPTVWNSLPDSLRDPAVAPDQFRREWKTHLFEWHCVSFSALAVFSRNALYK